MDNTSNKELKAQKKAYKKARRKATRPWKGLSIISGILAVILVAATVLLSMFDNTVAAFVGGTFWELENEDKNAIYYEGDFDSPEEMAEYGIELCKLTEAEGAALLMNENNALPLKTGARVSCFSNSSVNVNSLALLSNSSINLTDACFCSKVGLSPISLNSRIRLTVSFPYIPSRELFTITNNFSI